MPKRIQMTRQRPWRANNPDAVIVDRRSDWGNPFKVMEDNQAGRRQAVDLYKRWALARGEDCVNPGAILDHRNGRII